MTNVYVVVETATFEGTDGDEQHYRVNKVFFNNQDALDYIVKVSQSPNKFEKLWHDSFLFIEVSIIE